MRIVQIIYKKKNMDERIMIVIVYFKVGKLHLLKLTIKKGE